MKRVWFELFFFSMHLLARFMSLVPYLKRTEKEHSHLHEDYCEFLNERERSNESNQMLLYHFHFNSNIHIYPFWQMILEIWINNSPSYVSCNFILERFTSIISISSNNELHTQRRQNNNQQSYKCIELLSYEVMNTNIMIWCST